MEGAVRNLEEEIISGYFTKYYNMIPETISFCLSNKNDEKNKGELFKTLLCI